MLKSLCFTPETCEVIHDCAGIIKSLCWYKTVEGEKQSRSTRDVWCRREVLMGEGVGPGAARAEEAKENSALANSPFLSLPTSVPSSLAGRGTSLAIAEKHLQISNPLSKRAMTLFGWEGRGRKAWFELCVCKSVRPSVSASSVDVLQKDKHHLLCCSPTLSCRSCCVFCCHSFLHCRELGKSLLNVLSTLNRALCSRV